MKNGINQFTTFRADGVRGRAGRFWRESDLGRNEETLTVITSGLPVIILELQTTVGISQSRTN